MNVKPHRFHFTAFLLIISVLGLLFNVVKILTLSQQNGSTQTMSLSAIQPIYIALVFLIMIQAIGGREGATWLLSIITRATNRIHNGVVRTARWQTMITSDRLTTAIVPVLIVQTLVVGLYELLFGMADAKTIDLQNVWVSFLAYVGSPLVLVIANIVSVAMLKGRLQKQNLAQLALIGFTRTQLFLERGAENCFQLSVLFVASILNNSILYGLMMLACTKVGRPLSISFLTEFTISLSVVLITFIALWLIDVIAILAHPMSDIENRLG